MSNLKFSVRGAITSYLQQQGEAHTPTDVLRVLRDQATLMYERQLVCDALDSDPLEQLGGIHRQINRVKEIMDVASCNRVVTGDGYSSIDAVIELQRDEHMNRLVESNVKLNFHYERRKARPEDYDSSMRHLQKTDASSGGEEGTHIWYWIDVARDYGEKERLVTIEVWAAGAGPSMNTAKLWDDEMEVEEQDAPNTTRNNNDADSTSNIGHQINDDSTTEIPNDSCDRFAAFVDPEVLSDFLQWTRMDDMDLGTSVFFLLTFPFYEHEWDLVAFLFEAVFGEVESEDNEDETVSGDEINRIVSDEE